MLMAEGGRWQRAWLHLHGCYSTEKSLSLSLHDSISFASNRNLRLSDHKSIRTELIVLILAAWKYFQLRGLPEADMVFHLGKPYICLFQPFPVTHLWQGVPQIYYLYQEEFPFVYFEPEPYEIKYEIKSYSVCPSPLICWPIQKAFRRTKVLLLLFSNARFHRSIFKSC